MNQRQYPPCHLLKFNTHTQDNEIIIKQMYKNNKLFLSGVSSDNVFYSCQRHVTTENFGHQGEHQGVKVYYMILIFEIA